MTILDLLLCYPLAYYLGQSSGSGYMRILVLFLIIPYWVNEILRAFAFRIIFGDSGVINEMLLVMGIIDNPVDFIRDNVALYSGLGYAYILLMIFPMYNVIESLDRNQIEAARVAINRKIKRGGKVWIRIFPDKPFTKKPAETRMGSGKGNPEGWVAVVRAGRVMFEMSGVDRDQAMQALKIASQKLPLKTKITEAIY